MNRVSRDQYLLIGMSIGAGGAALLAIFFGTLTSILWFAAISIVGLLYSLYLFTGN